MKNIAVGITLCFFITGCVTSSETLRPAACISKEKTAASDDAVVPSGCPFAADRLAIFSPSGPITYSGITNVIDVFFEIKAEKTRFSGTSDNNLMNLEMVGQEDEILEASLRLNYPKDIKDVDFDLNSAVMLRFLKNAAPGYKKWQKDVKGIMDKFSSMRIGKKEKDKIVLGKRIINVLYDKNINAIILTVKSK